MKYLGAFTQDFHIRPWEIDLLTVGEFLALCDLADRQQEELEQSKT